MKNLFALGVMLLAATAHAKSHSAKSQDIFKQERTYYCCNRPAGHICHEGAGAWITTHDFKPTFSIHIGPDGIASQAIIFNDLGTSYVCRVPWVKGTPEIDD